MSATALSRSQNSLRPSSSSTCPSGCPNWLTASETARTSRRIKTSEPARISFGMTGSQAIGARPVV